MYCLSIMKEQNGSISVVNAHCRGPRSFEQAYSHTTLLLCKLYLNYGQTKDCQVSLCLASLCFRSFDFVVSDEVRIKLVMTA